MYNILKEVDWPDRSWGFVSSSAPFPFPKLWPDFAFTEDLGEPVLNTLFLEFAKIRFRNCCCKMRPVCLPPPAPLPTAAAADDVKEEDDTEEKSRAKAKKVEQRPLWVHEIDDKKTIIIANVSIFNVETHLALSVNFCHGQFMSGSCHVTVLSCQARSCHFLLGPLPLIRTIVYELWLQGKFIKVWKYVKWVKLKSWLSFLI